MILREIFSYAGVDDDNTEDYRYEPEYDQSVVDLDDTRKTRLTLQQINSCLLYTSDAADE